MDPTKPAPRRLREQSHIPRGSFFFEKAVPALLLFMAFVTIGLILFAAGVLLGLIQF